MSVFNKGKADQKAVAPAGDASISPSANDVPTDKVDAFVNGDQTAREEPAQVKDGANDVFNGAHDKPAAPSVSTGSAEAKRETAKSATLAQLKAAAEAGKPASVRSLLTPAPSNQFVAGAGLVSAEPREFSLVGLDAQVLLALAADPDIEVSVVG